MSVPFFSSGSDARARWRSTCAALRAAASALRFSAAARSSAPSQGVSEMSSRSNEPDCTLNRQGMNLRIRAPSGTRNFFETSFHSPWFRVKFGAGGLGETLLRAASMNSIMMRASNHDWLPRLKSCRRYRNFNSSASTPSGMAISR